MREMPHFGENPHLKGFFSDKPPKVTLCENHISTKQEVISPTRNDA